MQCTSWWGSFFFWSFVLICNKLATFGPIPKDVHVHEHHDLGSLYPIHLSFETVQKMFMCTWTPWPWLVYIQSIYPSKLFKICSHSKDAHVYMNTMTLASLYPIHLSFKPIQKMFIAMHDVKEIGFLETLMGMS